MDATKLSRCARTWLLTDGPVGVGKPGPPLAFETGEKGVSQLNCLEYLRMLRLRQNSARPGEAAPLLTQFFDESWLHFARNSHRSLIPGVGHKMIHHFSYRFRPAAELQDL